ncbi:MAG: glutamate synthase-related protein [Spirochaetales bacterium]|nr:glutamate synthase-related protein [Spirochaetales bacterium]
MSLSSPLAGPFTKTKLRTAQNMCDLSGMCSVCSDRCSGLCEIGLSAVRGEEAAYPYDTSSQQFASEKTYPFDFSHFNINGRVFGAMGAPEDREKTNVHSVNLDWELGEEHKIKLKAPLILPAMVKLNWPDYYAGAAMAGVMAVVGENALKKDPELKHDGEGQVCHAPLLGEIINCFRQYDRGYGDIVLQVNADDIALGTAEYALQNFPLNCIEIKFGQGAKGIQHVAPVYTWEEAVLLKKQGYLVFPDPWEEGVKEKLERDEGFYFMQYGRLPMWDEESLAKLIRKYRDLGAKNIFFKMAGYDKEDIRRVIKIASLNRVTLITFDGAGGGTGHSPCKMMNEWSYPTLDLLKIVNSLMDELKEEGQWLPQVAIAGGLALEDSVFKALALGAPHIRMAGVGRAAMAAAMSGKKLGELIEAGQVPKSYQSHGETGEAIFHDAKFVRSLYKERDEPISYGAIGLFSYLKRLSFGMRLLMTLNRKFRLDLIDRSDLIPLTGEAREYLKD